MKQRRQLWLVGIGVLLPGLLGHVLLQAHILKISYEIRQQDLMHAECTETVHQLHVRRAWLASPQHLERRLQALGSTLTYPTPAQIVVVPVAPPVPPPHLTVIPSIWQPITHFFLGEVQAKEDAASP